MCKRSYKTEDFVLDPEFQKWVVSPDTGTKSYWEAYLRENPEKHAEIVMARKLVLHLSRKVRMVDDSRIEKAWGNIDHALNEIQQGYSDKKVIPLDSSSTLRQFEKKKVSSQRRFPQFYRLVGILLLAFSVSFLINFYFPQPVPKIAEVPVIYEEHVTPPGVKSNLTLQDGSKVILNSGSSLRYIKNFETHQRIVELRGEAFFDVAKETERPFTVRTGPVSTTALGTSFNIKAYENESMNISLLTGRVLVKRDSVLSQPVDLQKGEGVEIDLKKLGMKRIIFDQDRVLAWTKKTIVFDHSPMWEIKRVLENWYGVSIWFSNSPHPNLEVSGRFQDQTLKNVLEGLSYSARFEFTIDKDRVTLVFN
ncbi:FecR protein [Cyclobacterium xiamenense]|uniref:FecR protein n=1 Tax=Cyclobacterium xiamenense TaxID=1297121 RepID=A0A1H7A541_9BACT|nr:FecR family protein [Cyclobacterium xiamenense]SEJ60701.1 FecR protein [Cyclobacterium xiamenense]